MRSPLDSRAFAAAFAAAIAVALLPATAGAQGQRLKPKMSGPELVTALEGGGHVLLLRHGATEKFVADENRFDLVDCKTQRNLSDAGRRQSQEMGERIRERGVSIGRVRSSPYCRCLDTGRLAFGEEAVEVEQVLSVGDHLDGKAKHERAKTIRGMLATAPAPGQNDVLITHTGTLLYTFGLQTQPEGIAHVFRPNEFGPAVYMGFVLPDDWAVASADSAAKP